MQASTRQIIDTVLKNDPSMTQEERARVRMALSAKAGANPQPQLLRRKEAAGRLGLSLRAVDRLCREGTLTKRILPGRKRATGIMESELSALICGEDN